MKKLLMTRYFNMIVANAPEDAKWLVNDIYETDEIEIDVADMEAAITEVLEAAMKSVAGE
jgi:hypothetical protein